MVNLRRCFIVASVVGGLVALGRTELIVGFIALMMFAGIVIPIPKSYFDKRTDA